VNLISLCTGIGGLEYFTHQLGIRTLCHVEKDEDARKVLASRYPNIPLYRYMETFTRDYRETERPDIVCAGIPCQPHSTASGKNRKGANDTRNLWPCTADIIDAFNPRYFILENVRGIVSTMLQEIEADLEARNYQVRSYLVQANSFGYDDKRERIILVAHNPSIGVERLRRQRLKIPQSLARPFLSVRDSNGQWEIEPDVCRAPSGLPRKLDFARLKQLGNAVKPEQALPFWLALVNYEMQLLTQEKVI